MEMMTTLSGGLVMEEDGGEGDVQPPEGEDQQEGDLLAHGDLEFPELADGEGGDEEVCGYVQGGVGVVHSVRC
jgi:hypothetical protein